jgi:hypothetical protein
LGSLFDKNRVRTFVKCLESLQDELGYANDIRVAYGLVDQISKATNQDTRAIDRAGGIVLGLARAGSCRSQSEDQKACSSL